MAAIFRILIDIGLVVSVLNGWWIPGLILAILGLWFFSYYLEIVIAAIMYDSLFGYYSTYMALGALIFFSLIKIVVRK